MTDTTISERSAVIEHLRKLVDRYHAAGKSEALPAQTILDLVVGGAVSVTLIVHDDGGVRVQFK